MGSKVGYGYRYEFLTVHEDEIISKNKSNREPGSRGFLFEFRTNFVLKTTSEEEEEEVLDSETFDGYVETKDYDYKSMTTFLCYEISYRLNDYWMTLREMKSLVNEALAFANEPKHAHLNPVPIVVRLDVCTVQRAGEPYNAALERAITARNLTPLYLWPQPTIAVPKPMGVWVLIFLGGLEKIRVEDVDKAAVMMRECGVCNKGPVFGAQISVLGSCNHAFHSNCIVRWLEDTNLCPLCNVAAYDESLASRPPIKGTPQDLLV